MTRKLSLDAARRIAVRATRLDSPRPKRILEVVRETGALQLDPPGITLDLDRIYG